MWCECRVRIRLVGLLAVVALSGACNSQDDGALVHDTSGTDSTVPYTDEDLGLDASDVSTAEVSVSGTGSTVPYTDEDLGLDASDVSTAEVSVSGTGSTVPYTDEDLGLDHVVDTYRPVDISFARFRTAEERWAAEDELEDRIYTTSGHELERAAFELRLYTVMLAAEDTLPDDIGRHKGILFDALYEAVDECSAEAGWPQIQLYDVSNDDVLKYEREFGLSLEMFLDLRHECSKYAVTYPTLDPQYRDELLSRRREHFMQAVRDWVAANPDLVVPIEYHEGANTPYADRYPDS